MTSAINYSISIQVPSGPSVARSGSVKASAYDVLSVSVPDQSTDGGKITVDVQPSDEGVTLLVIESSNYEDLTYKVDGGATAFTLDAPLVLLGEGAVKLLGATQKQFEFKNAGDQALTVSILVGREIAA